MRSLKIIFWAESDVLLPVRYLSKLQGVLYHSWENAFPDLHDKGLVSSEGSDEVQGLRPFTFSWIQGKYKRDGEQIRFLGNRTLFLEVRSWEPKLLDVLVDNLLNQRSIRLGHTILPLIRLECADQLLFPSRAIIHMVTPVTVHHLEADGSTRYYSPWEETFPALLTQNLDTKLRAMAVQSAPMLGFKPLKNIKKQVTKFKETWITGYQGTFLLETEPQNMELLYYTGLGARNSQGFGMFTMDQAFYD